MRKYFIEHPEGTVVVTDGDRSYTETEANFEADFGEPIPDDMPAGTVERVFEPGVRHAYTGPDGVWGGGAIDWDYGTRAIDALPALMQKKAARDQAAAVAASAEPAPVNEPPQTL